MHSSSMSCGFFFFFFKQKTAYEMRISDWSSDVCSSDLLDKTVTGGWIALLQHHFFTAWIPQKDQAARFGLTTSGQVHGIHAMGPSFTLAPGAKAVTNARLWVGPKLVSQLAAQDVRSEEHTSELQSLMRISYAVFCLKKKNHK